MLTYATGTTSMLTSMRFLSFSSHFPPFSIPGEATQEGPGCGTPATGGELLSVGFQDKGKERAVVKRIRAPRMVSSASRDKRPKEPRDKESGSKGKGEGGGGGAEKEEEARG